MLRIFISLPLAIFISCAIFSSMVLIIGFEPSKVIPAASSRFDILMVEQESDVIRRKRDLPKREENEIIPSAEPKTSPQLSSMSSPKLTAKLPLLSMSDMGVNTSVDLLAISVPISNNTSALNSKLAALSEGKQQNAVPIHRVEPQYPRRAFKKNIEGYVTFSFTIDLLGGVKNIQVISSQPKGVFDREAKRALKRWKYSPKIVNGKAVPLHNQKIKIEFVK